VKTQSMPHSNLTCAECKQEASLYIAAMDRLMCARCNETLEMVGQPLPPYEGQVLEEN
jgi:ribosomal protein S27E